VNDTNKLSELQAHCERQAECLSSFRQECEDLQEQQRVAASSQRAMQNQLRRQDLQHQEAMELHWERAEAQEARIKDLEQQLQGLAASNAQAGGSARAAGGTAEAGQEWRDAQERTQAKLRKRQAQLESAIMQVRHTNLRSCLAAPGGLCTCPCQYCTSRVSKGFDKACCSRARGDDARTCAGC
jgi:hypothetical protein